MSSQRRLPVAPAVSGRREKNLDYRLDSLPSIMTSDPKGHQRELELHYKDFNSSLELFKQQIALSFSSVDPTVAERLGSLATFLSRVAPLYPNQLADFPEKLADLLRSAARFPSELRIHLAKALRNPQLVDIEDSLELFMELQSVGDRKLGDLASSHVIETITKMNQKNKDRVKNEKLQKILFQLLEKDEQIAKRSLVLLCRLHKSKIWFESRTAEAICDACFHESPRVMTSAISFLLEYEKFRNDDDSDASSSEDEANHKPSMYKANHTDTGRTIRKKRIKLKRFDGSMNRRQRVSSKDSGSNYYSPLNHLKDAQGFAEKLLSKLEACNERFGVKMMMLKVIARIIELHHSILFNFYPYLQKYVQPDHHDITNILATAIQACHSKTPPGAVEPLVKQIVNQFILDQSSMKDIDVGLNAIREICLRIPLLITEELLQDLGLYKKSHEKAISTAARSLIDLCREVSPSLLHKKGCSQPTNPEAKPKVYASDVPDHELLEEDDADSEADIEDKLEEDSDAAEDGDDVSVGIGDNGESNLCSDDSEDELEEDNEAAEDGDDVSVGIGDNGESNLCSDDSEDELEEDNEAAEDGDDVSVGIGDSGESNLCSDDSEDELEEDIDTAEDVDGITRDDVSVGIGDDGESNLCSDDIEDELEEADKKELEEGNDGANQKEEDEQEKDDTAEDGDGVKTTDDNDSGTPDKPGARKRKASDFEGEGSPANLSLRALKKLAAAKAKKLAELRKSADFKIPISDELSAKPLDLSKLEVHVHKKTGKEERMSLVGEGREDRGKFQARTAMKQKKSGGLINQQQQKKLAPRSGKIGKVVKSGEDKRKKQQGSVKQFSGKKAWKN